MKTGSARRSAPRHTLIGGVLLASLAAHAVAVGTLEVRAPDASGKAALSSQGEGPEAQPLTFSCVADAALATSARLGVCASPFSEDRDACLEGALLGFELDRTKCHAVDVSFMAPEELDKVKPKPLMPDLEPQDDIVAAELLEEEVAEKLEEAREQIEQRKVNGQVVEITRPRNEMRPDQARYLAEYDSQVEEETVARGSTEEMVDRPQPKELPPSESPPEEPRAPKPEKPSLEAAPKRPLDAPPGEKGPKSESVMAMRGPGTGKELPKVARRDPGGPDGFEGRSAEDGPLPKKGKGEISSSKSTELEPPGGREPQEGDGGGGKPKIPDLRPSEEMLSRTVGGGSVDKLDGVKRGETTGLNAKKWKYAAFFNRMKRQVAQNWHPDKVYMRRDPRGKVYGTKDRLTVLKVSLTPTGALADVYVLKKSGVDFLDDEAVNAFRKAQPFPNPPAGLLEEGKRITFSFGFHFQIGDSSGWKLKWWR